jgi:3-hydroxypropionate dehydrogenase (NADP+)
VGCGLIGTSWATFFASKGLLTRMYDVDMVTCERGAQRARENLRTLVDLKHLPSADFDAALANLQTVNSLEELLTECDYVQESVLEDYDTKAQVFRAMEQHLSPAAIIATSSSGLLMSRMQQALEHPARSLITHPFNPPHLIPLVELVPGERTSAETVTAVKSFFYAFGQASRSAEQGNSRAYRQPSGRRRLARSSGSVR